MNTPTLNLFDQLTESKKRDLEAAFAEKHSKIGTCGKVIKEAVSTFRARGWRTHEPIWNAALFLNTVCYDLSIGIIDLVRERDDWKRRFVARSLALLLFEMGEDIPSVFGKKFRDAAISLGVLALQLDRVGMEIKKVTTFWNENRVLLKTIRTIAGAHRDHDALALHKAIDDIDLFELLGLGLQLGSISNSLGEAIQAILDSTANVAPPELKNR